MSVNFLTAFPQFEVSINSFRKKKALKKAKFYKKVGWWSLILGFIVLVFLYLPSVWYSLNGSEKLGEFIARKFSKKVPTVESPVKETYQPRFDPSLTREARIAIPAIGVDSTIQESTYENYENALEKGIWRVPDFGTPYERSSPTILAAHRFGYLAWTNIYRRKNSFFNLPKLKEGDTVEIVWRQRRYVYEIYKTGKGEEIEDYSADLILYTCENLDSPVRIFKYARLLEI